MNTESGYHALLQPLLVKEQKLSAELDSVRIAISALRSAADADVPTILSNQRVEGQEPPEVSPIFAGMNLPDMTYKTLDMAGRALVSREILDVWKEHGAAPLGSDALKKVQVALNRRATKVGDIIHIGDGKWGIHSWYTETEVLSFADNIDGANARDREEHRKKTEDGIKRAMARGGHYGAPPKLREHHWDRAIQLTQEGDLNWTEIHKELVAMQPDGDKPFSYQLVMRHREAFKNGDPYPEKWRHYFENRETTSRETNVRIIK